MANQIFHGGIDTPALNELTRAKIAKLAALADAIEVDDGMVSFSGDIFAPEFITLGTWGDEDFDYTVDDLELATITGFTDRGKAKCVLYRGAVTIPSHIGGNYVSYIAEDAFADNTDITSVNLDTSQIIEIGARAFSGCTSLKSINLEVVEDIDSDAFKWCIALEAIDLSDTQHVRSGCFSGCTSLSSVLIPGCRSIATAAFENTQSLKSIDLPDSLETLANDAFAGSGCVEAVDGVRYVDTWAIGAADTTTTATLRSGTVGIAESAFEGHTALASVSIPDSVIHLNANAFAGCALLLSVAIPGSVTSIGDSAFKGCTSLTSVTIGDGVKSIGDYAFYGCTSLTSVVIPDSVGSENTTPTRTADIGDYAFSGCTALTSVDTGNGVIVIGQRSFTGCTALRTVTFGNKVQDIGYAAFQGCTALTGLIQFPASLRYIETNAFRGCTQLTTLAFSDGIEQIGGYAFEGSGVISFSDGLPRSLKYISEGAFANCARLGQVMCGRFGAETDTTLTIQKSAFENSGCSDATFQYTQTIGESAFSDCSSLDRVVFGDTLLTTIEKYAFYPCDALTQMNYNGTMDEFNAIEKASAWAGPALERILCSDGDIEV